MPDSRAYIVRDDGHFQASRVIRRRCRSREEIYRRPRDGSVAREHDPVELQRRPGATARSLAVRSLTKARLDALVSTEATEARWNSSGCGTKPGLI
jgi:hypothetical protein